MHRPGTDPDNVRMEDVLCDFCHRPWVEQIPMIEGHQGSVICGRCLRVAIAELSREAPKGTECHCTMCLEQRDEPGWQSPAHPDAVVCRRCAEQAATTLERSPDFQWSRSGEPGEG